MDVEGMVASALVHVITSWIIDATQRVDIDGPTHRVARVRWDDGAALRLSENIDLELCKY